MAIHYAIGDALVTKEELFQKTEEMKSFVSTVKSKGNNIIKFETGKLTTDELVTTDQTKTKNPVTPFTQVGMFKPLTVELRHLYTGMNPKSGFLGKKKDMLVSSALKGFVNYDAAPKAINMIRKDVSPNSNIKGISAGDPGTPLLCYSPAVTQPATVLSLEVIYDVFPLELFNKISTSLTAMAGIPVFASASFYLVAAGMVTKLLGKAGEALFDGQVAFRIDDELSFERPGAPIPVADFRLLTQSNFDDDILKKYRLSGSMLVDEKGRAYDGDHPYVVISLDGKEVKAYEAFAPTMMTAALLERFYNVKDGKEQGLDILVEAMTLFNDFKYRTDADKIKTELSKLTAGTPEYLKLDEKFKALVANISEPKLKP